MTTPLDPAIATKSRKVLLTAERGADNRGTDAAALMERDVQGVLGWLNDQPLRTITSQAMIQWCKDQTPPWTPGYRHAVLDRVGEVMKEQTQAAAATVKARMLSLIDRLIPECREVEVSGGDLILDKRHPSYQQWLDLKAVNDAWLQYDRRMGEDLAKTGASLPTRPVRERLTPVEIGRMEALGKCLPYLTKVNHTAVQGYLKLVAGLSGVLEDKSEHRHVHFHAALRSGDLSTVPLAELEAGEAYLEDSRGSDSPRG